MSSLRRLSPRRLAEVAIARPRRMLVIWAVIVLVGLVLTAGLLGSALTSEFVVLSNPESKQAEDLIIERLPDRWTRS